MLLKFDVCELLWGHVLNPDPDSVALNQRRDVGLCISNILSDDPGLHLSSKVLDF